MTENQIPYEQEEEVNLVSLLFTVLHKYRQMAAAALVCAVLFAGVAVAKNLSWNAAVQKAAEEGDPNNFQDLYAGYWIKDADGKIVTSQLLVGQYYSDVIEDGQHVELGTYVQQTGSSTKVPRLVGMFPGLLPVKLILEKTSTSINSTTTTTTAKETGRYTMDGKRVYLPVRGINIVKMSDGTVRKVMKK